MRGFAPCPTKAESVVVRSPGVCGPLPFIFAPFRKICESLKAQTLRTAPDWSMQAYIESCGLSVKKCKTAGSYSNREQLSTYNQPLVLSCSFSVVPGSLSCRVL